MGFDFYEWSARAVMALKSRSGEKVGEDAFGNVYFRERKPPADRAARRWVVYEGESEASRVPPEWHAWLHYTVDEVPGADSPYQKPWVQEHKPNLTGTMAAYRPPGSLAGTGDRDRATGDYEAWSPEG